MEAVGHIASNMFPSLGPVLMISMGYIDLGKWVTAMESGARFGYDLVLLVVFFNLIAIFCQYLATCVAMATRKNLAQICSEEYCRSACKILGVQAVVSIITSELTMILGIAHGINLLMGLDLWPSIFLAIAAAVFMPFLTLMGKWLDEVIYISIAGFCLLFYVLGVLITQPEIPIVKDVIFPKLSGESSYLLVALLGANVMAHNFYIHSSIVQHRKLPTVSMGALFHDHFFAIMFIFTSIFLVNYVLMNLAAALFRRTDVVFSFQDVSSLMDQVFWTPIAPVAIFLVLLFSSQISSLTWSVGGQLILQYLFGANLSSCINQLFVKTLPIILALCCAKCMGTEGIYQLLIFGQIVQAMLLPSSVIPLFRVASSKLLMGSFKISFYMEILSLLAFFGMLASNVIFITEMLLGHSSWVNDLGGAMGITMMIPYAVLLLLACISAVSTLYLAVTPMKSASNVPETEIWSSHSQIRGYELSEVREVTDQDKMISLEDQVATTEPELDNSAKCYHDKSVIETNPHQPCRTSDPEDEFHQSTQVPSDTASFTTPLYHPIEAKSIIEADMEVVDKMSADVSSGTNVLKGVQWKGLFQRDIPLGADYTDKHSEGSAEFEESHKKSVPANKSENLASIKHIMGKGLDGESVSLSKLSGLGRASRRQLAAILDEFWGYLFDLHGKLAQEALVSKFDVLLGFDAKSLCSSAKVDPGTESSKIFSNDPNGAINSLANSMRYSSLKGTNSTLEFAYGTKMETASWSHDLQLSNTHLQRPSSILCESVQRPRSSLHMLYNSDNWDYQPATIHGYQLASYAKGMGAGRSPYSLFVSVDPPTTINSAAPFVHGLRESVLYARRQTGLHSVGSSGLQSPTASRASKLQVEASYYDHSLIKPGTVGSSANAKKYHSSPDISAIIAASRNGMKRGDPIGSKPSSRQMTSEPSQNLNPLSRNAFPLPFDEISPPKLQEDVFSVQSSMNKDTKSLWSTQPFEQLFGPTNRGQRRGAVSATDKPTIAAREMFPYSVSESKLLQSFRICIAKLLNLEGSDWLFRQNGGSDEELINKVVLSEKNKQEPDANEINKSYSNVIRSLSSLRKLVAVQGKEETDFVFSLAVPNCGDDCVWRASLVVSFGVWCVRRVLELSLVESRPELWGKYTYVLNRLQGILDIAFVKPRHPLATCYCLENQSKDTKTCDGLINNMSDKVRKQVNFTTASAMLEIIKDVEIAVAGRKGRTGTPAGDVAFPKGKENLASVLKRYKRRLSTKFPGGHEGIASGKIHTSSVDE